MEVPPRWRFGPFEADPAERQLRADGQLVPVTAKAFALLLRLIAGGGRLVSKAELFDSVWAGTVVTDAALSRAIRELRVALGDDAASPRYIATVHRVGFRFVAPLSAVSPVLAADAARSTTPAPPALAGRTDELARLGDALQRARSGQRQIVFVTGEAGIGKTALVDAFRAQHADAGELLIASGRCIEQYGHREAYLPLLEALEGLARAVGAERLRALLLRYAPFWLAQLPWLAHQTEPAALQQALAGASSQRMLREITQALEVLAAGQPIVLWLEDLHWCDHATLDVLAFLAGRREPARLLVIGSFRPDEAGGAATPLHDLVHNLVQRGQAGVLALGLLGPPAIETLLQQRLGGADAALPVGELAAFLHRRTEGNALFTVALIDELRRRGRLVDSAGGWTLQGGVAALGQEVPDTLRALVDRQLQQLDDADRRLVEAAAVAGTDFCAAAVAAALQAELAEVEERCLRLARAGRLLTPRPPVRWPDGTESAGFGFLHALYWQDVHERVAPGRRAQWQQRIGEREEQAWGAQCASIATGLALRFEAARDLDRSLRYLKLAGASALARCAYLECVELLRHGLGLVVRLPPDRQPRQELDLLLPLGAALMAVQGYAAADVEACYRRALLLCRRVARPGELERVLRGLWNVALVRADLEPALDTAHELLMHATVSDETVALVDAFAKLGQTSLHRGDFVAARSHLELALLRAGDSDDAARLREAPRAAAYLAWVLWYTGRPQQALERAAQALVLAGRAASPHTTAFTLGFIGWLHRFLGDDAAMLALARQQRSVAEEHGLVYWSAWSDVLQGLGTGDLPRARAAIAAFEAMGALVGVSHFLSALAEAELAAGEPGAARAALDRAVLLLDRTHNGYHAAETGRLRGCLALAEGDAVAARAAFNAALALAQQQGALAIAARIASDLAALEPRRG